MHSIWIFFISILFLWNPGCSTDKKVSKNTETFESTKDTFAVKPDTIPTPEPPPPGLAPGQAKIKGEIIEFRDAEGTSNGIMIINVEKVLGYGSSTPPISVSDTIEVNTGSLEPNEIEIGKIVSTVISYQLMLVDSGKSSRWTLVKLEKD